MIGRKISDQTITCKVIKPMQVTINNNSSINLHKDESPNKQTTKVLGISYEPIHQNIGRVFGTSNNQVDLDLDITLNYENEFNRLNHNSKQDKDKNTLKNFRQTGRNDNQIISQTYKQTKQLTTRNVTHFFINHKEKPLNVEPIKNTNHYQKNISSLPQNELKKITETPKTQDVSLRTTKHHQTFENNNNPSNITHNQQSKTKTTNHHNKRNTANTKTLSTQKQKGTSINHIRPINQIPNNQQVKELLNVRSQKQIPKMNKHLPNQQSKQRLSIIQNSSKLASLASIQRHERSIKENEKSVKKNQKSKSTHVKDKSIERNERVKQKASELAKKQFDISFQPWGEISQESSVCIQNYSPNKSNELINQNREQQANKEQRTKQDLNNQKRLQLKAEQSQKQQRQHQMRNQQNQRQSFGNLNNKKQQTPKVNVSRVPFKKYMSVKEQIQEKLKQKKLKQQQLQLKRRQMDEQRKLEEKQKDEIEHEEVNNNSNQVDGEQSEEQEYEQQRRDIPQPIQVPFVQPIKNQPHGEQVLQDIQTENQIDNHNDREIIAMDNNHFISCEIMAYQLEQLQMQDKQTNQKVPHYKYVESSEQEHEGQQEQTKRELVQQYQIIAVETELEQIKGTSQMVMFELDQQNLQNIPNLNQLRKFQQDLQEQLYHKILTHQQYSRQQENSQPFEDQPINPLRDSHLKQKKNPHKNHGKHPSIPSLCQNKIPPINQNISSSCNQNFNRNSSQPNSNKPVTSNKTPSSKPIIKKQQQQQQSDEQEEEQTNPKLLEYLKNRNLISSNKSLLNTKPNPKSSIPQNISKSTINQPNQSKLKISELLNNKTYNQPTQQVIIELDEEYLQSSIIANQSTHSQTHQDTTQHHIKVKISHQNYIPQPNNHINIDFYQPQIYSLNHSGRPNIQIEISDSSIESQPGEHSSKKNKPLINNIMKVNESSIDELFDLNLESLLNKEFININ